MESARKPPSRPSPRERTRRLLVQAARDLLREGAPLTVPEVAERAGVSRATAYRYFPHNDAVALHATILDSVDPMADPQWTYTRPTPDLPLPARVAALVRGMAEWAFDHRQELQTVLALSLQPDAEARGFSRQDRLRRHHLIDAILADLPPTVDPATRKRLALALVPLFGADAVVWTTQAGALDPEEAIEQLAWTAELLVEAVVSRPGSPPT